MRRISNSLSFGRTAKAVTAVLALVLILALGIFAASPSLHLRLHASADHPDRLCVVCAFANGQLGWTETITVAVMACLVLFYSILPKSAPVVSLFDSYFSPNRAPPRV
ncbi:MAG: hypothetical protein ACLQVY_07075 [Limisphaerales bacterium]